MPSDPLPGDGRGLRRVPPPGRRRAAVPSLRRRLAVSLAVIVGGTLTMFSVALDLAFTRAVWRQFDARLA